MAHTRTAEVPLGLADAAGRPSEGDMFKLQQYDKIVQLCDAILSGSHPRVKLPTGADVSAQASAADAAGALSQNLQSFSSNAQKPSVRPEINPIFLEKSDDLIRAELQLQRQRLERALRDEVEQRRAAKHAQAEPLADHDLSDVLVKALTLVQATAPFPPATENLTANNEAASDSFDDNTFYSSRHDTPESHLTSRVRNDSDEGRVPEQPHQSPHSPANGLLNLPPGPPAPGLNNYVDGAVSTGPSQNTSGEQSQSEESVPGDPRRLNDAYAAAHPPSPLVRAHDLQPVAPQLSQVSPLAVAARPRHADAGLMAAAPTGPPAQVAALRNEPGAVTSPESSSHGARVSEKKKGKKKKRKADRQAPEIEPAPYIKPEPRSPSPLANVSYIRPNKRPRHQRQADEPAYETPRYESGATNGSQYYYPAEYDRDEPTLRYEGGSARPQQAASTGIHGYAGRGAAYVDDRRISGEAYMRQRPSPAAMGLQHPSRGAYLERPASHVPNDPYEGSARTYRDHYEAPRMTARPESEFYMEQPRQQPARIIVDASGREYIEPPPPPRPLYRQSAAPSARPADAEMVYERAPPRAVSRHPGATSYEEGNVVYARPSPPYAMPRRVVTQPEYVSHEYRESRPREYSTRPVAPHGEYVQVMAPPERRQAEEYGRDYGGGAPGLRPAEPVRYGAPHEYGRLQSARPEAPAREYAAGGLPEGRRETVQPYARGYAGGPGEQPMARQEYSVRPVERYYEPQRGGEQVAFIERPRGATQEVVYADDARREVYR